MKMPNVAVLPALATLGNAVCGFAAVLLLFRATPLDGTADDKTRLDVFLSAALLIFLAMVFDAIDGRIARFARVTSDFGGQLDSLADAISFGLAPAVLGYRFFMQIVPLQMDDPASLPLHRLAVVLATVYFCCALLRLARFNVENVHDEEAHMAFRGLPSPAAAGAVAAAVILILDVRADCLDQPYASWLAWSLPGALLTLGILMVSRVRYAHLLNQLIRGRRPLSYIIQIVICLALVFLLQEKALAALFFGFALSGPAVYLYRKLASLRHAGRPAAAGRRDISGDQTRHG